MLQNYYTNFDGICQHLSANNIKKIYIGGNIRMKGLALLCLVTIVTAAIPHHSLQPAAIGIPILQATQNYGIYSTTFDEKDEARRVNITQAAKSINGTVVQPGQEFSFNQTVGPTIKRRGYMAGKIFVNGKTKLGEGGGVCQVSSTLFCAATLMGLKTTERHPHSKPVNYVPKGYDAATSYGVIDYKFVNNFHFPVIIEAAVEGNTLTVLVRQYN